MLSTIDASIIFAYLALMVAIGVYAGCNQDTVVVVVGIPIAIANRGNSVWRSSGRLKTRQINHFWRKT